MELNYFSITILEQVILHAQRLQSHHPLPEDYTEHDYLRLVTIAIAPMRNTYSL